jgi:hypothetical protein
LALTTEVEEAIEDVEAQRRWLAEASVRFEQLLHAMDEELQRAEELHWAVANDTLVTHEATTSIEDVNERLLARKDQRNRRARAELAALAE